MGSAWSYWSAGGELSISFTSQHGGSCVVARTTNRKTHLHPARCELYNSGCVYDVFDEWDMSLLEVVIIIVHNFKRILLWCTPYCTGTAGTIVCILAMKSFLLSPYIQLNK